MIENELGGIEQTPKNILVRNQWIACVRDDGFQ
jgi:hypothetical protein